MTQTSVVGRDLGQIRESEALANLLDGFRSTKAVLLRSKLNRKGNKVWKGEWFTRIWRDPLIKICWRIIAAVDDHKIFIEEIADALRIARLNRPRLDSYRGKTSTYRQKNCHEVEQQAFRSAKLLSAVVWFNLSR
jgi:hypothetical protein